jgi:uroporphyrinogen decarboxylase
MDGRERVLRAIEFREPDRLPLFSPILPLSDIFFMTYYPASDWQPAPGVAPYIHDLIYLAGNWRWREWTPFKMPSSIREHEDEFGCIRESLTADTVGEITGHPLKNIEDAAGFPFPDPHRPERFETFERLSKALGRGKFIIGDMGIGLWERAHFLRGFPEAMEDLALRPEHFGRLLDRLVDEWLLGLAAEYAARGCHGVLFTDDWGMQDRAMVSLPMWRRIFKPRYERLFNGIHALGMKSFMHSCGRITSLLDDFIDAGLDVVQKDDLEVIGIDHIAENYRGRICFLSPLDVQKTLPGADAHTIASETKRLIERVGSHGGGLIGTIVMAPTAVGISWRQIAIMQFCFILYGRARPKT